MRKIENLNKALQLIFYVVWILLGVLIFGVVIYLIAANPLAKIMPPQGGPSQQQFQGGPNQGGFGIQGGNQPGGQQQPGSGQQGGQQSGQLPPPSGQPANQQSGGQQPR